MSWLKTTSSAVWVGILGFLAAMAIFAAKRKSGQAEKWHDKAVDIETGNVVKGTTTAAAASTQAALHDNKAKAIKAKAEARITQMADKDREISDILDGWRK